MPKPKVWTKERLPRGLLGIAQLDALPSQLHRTDAQSPPAAYLSAAVAAIGEGSTHSGFFQQLTNLKTSEEPGLGDAVIGGLEPLLQKMAGLVDQLPGDLTAASQSTAPFAFASILRLLNGVLTRPHPGQAALLHALSVAASCVEACSGNGAPETAVLGDTCGSAALRATPETIPDEVMSESPNYADQGRQIDELTAEREQLLKELERLRNLTMLTSKAAAVLGGSHLENMLDGVAQGLQGRSSVPFNQMSNAYCR